MLALDVRHLELGIVTLVTCGLAIAVAAIPANCPVSAPAMPQPAPEPVAVRHTEVTPNTCDDPNVTTLVFKGRVNARESGEPTTLVFSFAELPAAYSVMTGARGEFEIRIPRAELAVDDLCELPSAGRNAAFKDAQLTLEYTIEFER